MSSLKKAILGISMMAGTATIGCGQASPEYEVDAIDNAIVTQYDQAVSYHQSEYYDDQDRFPMNAYVGIIAVSIASGIFTIELRRRFQQLDKPRTNQSEHYL